jgi:hypothetical protein
VAISAAEVETADHHGTLQVAEPTAAVSGTVDVVFPVLHGP